VFLLVHIAQVARAGWKNLRAMIAGFEIVQAGELEHERKYAA
jgi:hypothetical protein